MINETRNWFVGLSQREKILVGVAGLLLAGAVGYYGMARPMAGAMASAEERYMHAVERQVRIDTKVAALQEPVDAKVSGFTATIDDFISQSAGETGIAVGSINPQSDDRVNMVVESAKPTALFGWLARIERDGISVESLNVDPAANGTISATLTLRSH